MDNQDSQTDQSSNPAPQNLDIDTEVQQLKKEIINNASNYAMRGKKTHEEPDESSAGPYDWWENQGSYEGNTWSVAFWRFGDNSWKLQATRVELKPDGHSQMYSYTMRLDSDPSFPGFQVYREAVDDRYHAVEDEDVVYLDRVMKGLLGI